VNPFCLIKQLLLHRLKLNYTGSAVLPKEYLQEMVLLLATSCSCVKTMEKVITEAALSGGLQEGMVDVINKVFHPIGSSGGVNWNEEETLTHNAMHMEAPVQNSADLLSAWFATRVNTSPNVLSLFVGQSIVMGQTNRPKHWLTTLGVNHHYLCWQELWQKRYNDDEVQVSGIIASMLGLYRKQDLDLSLAELEYVVFPYSVIERESNISSNEATTEAVFGHQKDEKVEGNGYQQVATHVVLSDWQSLARLLQDDKVRT